MGGKLAREKGNPRVPGKLQGDPNGQQCRVGEKE